MKSILRFVSAKERLPTIDGLYITIYSPAGFNLSNELVSANKQKIRFLAQESNHFDVYWLEEVELPTDEAIEGFSFAYRTTIQQGEGFIRGAKFIRDRYLADSVKD